MFFRRSPRHRWALIVAGLTVCLAGCSRSSAVSAEYVRGGRSGLLTSTTMAEVLVDDGGRISVEPALGALTTSLLLSESEGTQDTPETSAGGSASPNTGEAASVTETIREHTAFLETAISLLSTDVQLMLNQASNRESALNYYLGKLRTHAMDSSVRLRTLESQQEKLDDDESRIKRRTKDAGDELDEAIRSGQTLNTEALLQELFSGQRELIEVQTELSVTERFVESYTEVSAPLQERLTAIEANRDALLKGVSITDIPGVDDLGILRRENGKLSIRKRSTSSFSF